MESRL